MMERLMTFEEFKSYYLANCSAVVVTYDELVTAFKVYLNGFVNNIMKEWTA